MSSPVRIAILADPFTMVLQGASHARELMRELASRGHVVRAFGPAAARISDDDEVATTGSLLAFDPDGIVAYDPLSPAAFFGSRVARRLGVPLVLVELGGTAGVGSLQRLLWGVGRKLWGRYVRRTATCVIAVDPAARERAVGGGFDPSRVEIVPHGVDVTRYAPGRASALLSRHGISGRFVLCAGPLEVHGGYEALINAFGRTLGRRHDWSLVVAARGPVPGHLRVCAERTGAGAHIRFVHASREDLPALFSAATVFAAPGLAETVRGVGVLRALASGVPVLASSVERHRFLLGEDEACGFLVEPGDTDEWTAALRRITGSPMVRARQGTAARERAVDRFRWGDVATRFESALARATADADTDVDALPLGTAAEHS